MTASMDMSEVDAFALELAATAATVKAEAPREVGKVAQEVWRSAHAAAPVRTGELQGSIYIRQEGDGWRIGSDKKQGFFQEFGTSVMPAQPWLFPAARDVPRKLSDVLGKLGAQLLGKGRR